MQGKSSTSTTTASETQSTALVKVEKQVETAIAKIDTSWKTVSKPLKDPDVEVVKAVRNDIKRLQKTQAADLKEWIRPSKTAYEEMKAKFEAVYKPRLAALDAYDAHLEGLLILTSSHNRQLAEKAAEKKAVKAEAKGLDAKAEEIREVAKDVALDGVTRTKRAEVQDRRAFFIAIANGELPEGLVEVKQGALDRYAKEHDEIPGCRVWVEESFSRRG